MQDGPSARRPSPPALTRWLHTIPFARAAGIRAEAVEPGGVITAVDAASWLSDPGQGASISRAAIAALLDQAASAAFIGTAGPWQPHATISLTVSFAREAAGRFITFHGRVAAQSGGLAHTVTEVRDAGGAVLAEALAVFVTGRYPGNAQAQQAERVEDSSRIGDTPIPPLQGGSFQEACGLARTGDGAAILPFCANLAGSRAPLAVHGGVVAASLIMTAQSELAAAGEPDGLHLAHVSVEFLRAAQPQATCFTATRLAQSRAALACVIDAQQENQGGPARHVARAQARFFRGGS